MEPAERYKRDPIFAAMVQAFLDMFQRYHGSGAGITPTEVREASGLAWQIYLERYPDVPISLTRRDFS